ncbi:MAG TPA: DTW domain-containing protein [Polyangiaceae bacterium]|nr:DTW domain-containing protein [Polyangiaceae bacterium]
MHLSHCLCAVAPPIPTQIQLVLAPHIRDWRRPSNTGRLAWLALEDVELYPFGVRGRPFDPLVLERVGARHLVLHPGGDAVPIERVCKTHFHGRGEGDVRLLVPDGTWRQSGRIANRLCQIPGALRVSVTPRPTGALRKRPSPNRACTAEAIATALSELGEPQAAASIRALLGLLLERTARSRGE